VAAKKKPKAKRKSGPKPLDWSGIDIVRGARGLHLELEQLLTALAERAGVDDFRTAESTDLAAALWFHGAPVYKTIGHSLKQNRVREQVVARLVDLAFRLARGDEVEPLMLAAEKWRADGTRISRRAVRTTVERKHTRPFGKQYALYRLLTDGSAYQPAGEALRPGPLKNTFVLVQKHYAT
jgi:hypothetical protein